MNTFQFIAIDIITSKLSHSDIRFNMDKNKLKSLKTRTRNYDIHNTHHDFMNALGVHAHINKQDKRLQLAQEQGTVPRGEYALQGLFRLAIFKTAHRSFARKR